MARIAVIGGGISGLACALALARARRRGADLEICLLEKGPRLGGVIRTEQSDGFLLEWGPENFVSYKPAALELIEEIGLGREVLDSDESRRRVFVADEGRLAALPEGMGFLVPVDIRSFWSSDLISTRGKLRALLEPLVPASRGDLSVEAFLSRRLGTEMTRKISEPLVSAIYGGDIARLSAASALPELHRMEQSQGSLWLGMRRRPKLTSGGGRRHSFFVSLRGGMIRMVDGIAAQLGKTRVVTGCGSLQLRRWGGKLMVEGSEAAGEFEAVVLTTPASATARLLESIAPDAAALLRQIPYSSTSIVYLAYRRSEFSHPLNGFGFVLPAAEAGVMDACTWVSSKFEGRCPPDRVLLRCAVHDGRHRRESFTGDQLLERVHGEVGRLLGISCQPVFARVGHARRVMPQLTVGHAARLERLHQLLPEGLFLSAAFHGVGVPDCIERATRTARKVVSRLAESA